MNRLKDKRALITGGTSGIGLETARQFLKEGARVAITGQNPATIEAARTELGSGVMAIRANAGDVEAQRAVAEAVRQAFGGLDILFVNAGVADLRPIEQWDEAGFDRSVAINLKGPFFLIQALLPILANPASIVLNASVNAHIGMPNTTIYGATKAGLLSLARTLSGELISRGIRVNAVSPGPISTPLYGKLGLAGANRKLRGRLCDTQSRQSGRGIGMDAWGAGAAGADTEREEDEPPECAAGAIRFSGIHIRAALQRADRQGVPRIQSVEEEREQDEAERGRASETQQCSTLGRSAGPAESEIEGLESILRLGEYMQGIRGARRTRRGARAAFPETAAQGAIARRPSVFDEADLRRVRGVPTPGTAT